jgi:Zn-finger nucleic acid-binding protein
MFAGMQFCPHCGVKADRSLEESGKTLPCPGCQASMQGVRVGSTPMYECGSCAGIWLDAPTFTQLCQDREQRGAVAATIGPALVGVVPTAGGRVRYVRCPVCKNMLNRENFGRQSGVIVDVCKNDGVWFERGELHSVLTFVDSGGLERARAVALARRSEERRALEQQFFKARPRESHHSVSISVHSEGSSDSLLGEALRSLFS